MIILIDMADFKYIYVSDAVRELLGYRPSDFVGHRAPLFNVADDAPHVRITMEDALLTGESVKVNIRFKTKNGLVQPIRGAVKRVIDPETDEVYLLTWVEAADR